ncbi:uncharacterized protein PV06_06642 [Exophiala oligosperma]|uniref:Uncharacterized protein n=1 Tax=Exophiala oligosperma TaxID=215243 RepID=A0A0D2DF85_9EURO|nr:uncharacterized protein PV06_06642 [Exophiala oligosperma]KIW41045.1 hypothetical protein PV06_06642 [Exophiala oligosperma]
MCYYQTYIFLGCGHAVFSSKPIANSGCLNGAHSMMQGGPSSSLTEICTEKLSHPLRTIAIDRLCEVCRSERDARVAYFQQHVGGDSERRIMTRSAGRNERGSERGRRLFRATTDLAMMLESSRNQSVAGTSNSGTTLAISSPTQQALGKFADGFRGVLEWNDGGSRRSVPSEASVSSPGPQVSRPQARLSFAALANDFEALGVD